MLVGWMTNVPSEFEEQPGGVCATTAAVKAARATKDFMVAEGDEMTAERAREILLWGG